MPKTNQHQIHDFTLAPHKELASRKKFLKKNFVMFNNLTQVNPKEFNKFIHGGPLNKCVNLIYEKYL